jgi:uncharacterized protein (DUF885 family)
MEQAADTITISFKRRRLYLLFGIFGLFVGLGVIGVLAYLYLSQGVATTNFVAQTQPVFDTISTQVANVKTSFDNNKADLNLAELAGDPKQLLNDTLQAQENLPPNPNNQTQSLHTMLAEYYSSSVALMTTVDDVQTYAILSTEFVAMLNSSVSSSGTDISTPDGITMLADSMDVALEELQADLDAIRNYSSTKAEANNFISASRPVVIVTYSAVEALSEHYRALAAAMESADSKGIAAAQRNIQDALDEIDSVKNQNSASALLAREALIDYLETLLASLGLLQLQINAEIQQLGN